jgi:RNA polymerase sigma factor (sigma-70 family)
LEGLFRFGAAGHLSDAELLGRFVARRDEAAEAAFAALVERHGPMVLGVCCRVLGDRHEAEDAFQATFLVLTRKAPSIARRERLASWLFGVACRTALGARDRATRRRAREQQLHDMTGSSVEPAGGDEADLCELRAILDEELARLPERYRGALVLCELEGLPRGAAAQRLGVPEGTLASRLARAKDALRRRLTRRGLALSVMALDAGLARESAARTLVVSFSLVDSTIRAATRVAVGAGLAEVTSSSVASLTQGALKAMLFAKSKEVMLGLATAAVITTGVGVLAQPSPAPDGDRLPPSVARAAADREARPSSAPDGDRLSALERKLDRILEALGGSRPDATPRDGGGIDPQGRGIGEAPRSALRGSPPAMGSPAPQDRSGTGAPHAARMGRPPERGAGRTSERPGAPAGSRSDPLVRNMTPDQVPDTVPQLPPATLGPPDNLSRRSSADLVSLRTLAARMDALEQRLAEVERRVRELDRMK